MHLFLGHPVFWGSADLNFQGAPAPSIQVLAKDQSTTQSRVDGVKHELRAAGHGIGQRRGFAHPPGGHRRHAQRLAQQLLAQPGQEAHECARFQHTGADGVGH
jgi:hypothetical protein